MEPLKRRSVANNLSRHLFAFELGALALPSLAIMTVWATGMSVYGLIIIAANLSAMVFDGFQKPDSLIIAVLMLVPAGIIASVFAAGVVAVWAFVKLSLRFLQGSLKSSGTSLSLFARGLYCGIGPLIVVALISWNSKPIYGDVENTIMQALRVSTLAILPPVFHLGIEVARTD